MKKFTHLLIALIAIFSTSLSQIAFAQDIPGYNMSNYAGVSGIDLQPASIADMRYKADICLVGAGIDINNNYLSINTKYLLHDSLFNKVHAGNFQSNLITENTSSTNKAVGMNAYVQLPSFAIAVSKNISIGFTARLRTLFNIDNVGYPLAHLMYTGLSEKDAKNLSYFQNNLNNNNFNINQMSWQEYGIDYAMVIIPKGPHFFKVGARAKLEAGLEAAYLYATNLQYNFKNSDTLNLYNSHFSEGQTQNLLDYFSGSKGAGQTIQDVFENVSTSSVAFDIGAVYEWRPNYKDYTYEMDGQKSQEKRNKNKYKLRLGASILDIGSISFQKGNNAFDFAANNLVNWQINNLKLGSNKLGAYDSIIQQSSQAAIHNFVTTDTKSSFIFTLPTTFSVQVDYNIYKDLYVNFTSYTAPHWLNVESQVHTLSYYSITPRWDSKWFGVFIPMGINGYGQATMGATVRLGPFIVGTSNGLNVLLANDIYGINAYAAIKIPIFQSKPPRDRDHDGVSDKYDLCPDKPGTWAHHGCPDTDGDGVYDDVDKCPTVKGPPENS